MRRVPRTDVPASAAASLPFVKVRGTMRRPSASVTGHGRSWRGTHPSVSRRRGWVPPQLLHSSLPPATSWMTSQGMAHRRFTRAIRQRNLWARGFGCSGGTRKSLCPRARRDPGASPATSPRPPGRSLPGARGGGGDGCGLVPAARGVALLRTSRRRRHRSSHRPDERAMGGAHLSRFCRLRHVRQRVPRRPAVESNYPLGESA